MIWKLQGLARRGENGPLTPTLTLSVSVSTLLLQKQKLTQGVKATPMPILMEKAMKSQQCHASEPKDCYLRTSQQQGPNPSLPAG